MTAVALEKPENVSSLVKNGRQSLTFVKPATVANTPRSLHVRR